MDRGLLGGKEPSPPLPRGHSVVSSSQSVSNDAYDGIINALVVINRKGLIVEFNSCAEKMFLMSKDEAIGKSVAILMPDPYKSRHDMFIRRYHASGRRHLIGKPRRLKGVRKDGSIFPLELSLGERSAEYLAHRDKAGADDDSIGVYIAIIRDLSDGDAASNSLDGRSRYRREFDEIQKLGSGSFGTVFMCRNKVDGELYAVKIICLYRATRQERLALKDDPNAATGAVDVAKRRAVTDGAAAPPNDAPPGSPTGSTTEELEEHDALGTEDGAPPMVMPKLSSKEMAAPAVPARAGSSHFNAYARRKMKETSLLARLPNHMNVVRYYSSWHERYEDANGVSRPSLFIQMQLCGSMSLKTWLNKRTRVVHPFESLDLFRQITRGLAHIHASRIVHRDMKPSNIIMDPATPSATAQENAALESSAMGPSAISQTRLQENFRSVDGPASVPGGVPEAASASPSVGWEALPHKRRYCAKISDFGLAREILGVTQSGDSDVTSGVGVKRGIPSTLTAASSATWKRQRVEDGSGRAAGASNERLMLPFMSVGIGTTLYGAPEQVQLAQTRTTSAMMSLSDAQNSEAQNTGNRGAYDGKADIFPLGLILFELFCPSFESNRARYDALSNARKGQLPREFVEMFPDVALLVRSLTSHRPEDRPNTKQIIDVVERLERRWIHGQVGGKPPAATVLSGAPPAVVVSSVRASRRGSRSLDVVQSVASGDTASVPRFTSSTHMSEFDRGDVAMYPGGEGIAPRSSAFDSAFLFLNGESAPTGTKNVSEDKSTQMEADLVAARREIAELKAALEAATKR